MVGCVGVVGVGVGVIECVEGCIGMIMMIGFGMVYGVIVNLMGCGIGIVNVLVSVMCWSVIICCCIVIICVCVVCIWYCMVCICCNVVVGGMLFDDDVCILKFVLFCGLC